MKNLKKQASVQLKTSYGEFEFSAFSVSVKDKMPHLVLRNNMSNNNQPENVRIHSECITGDLFGSCRCDCGPQLHKSLDYISNFGGMVIYLRQEGRGIGIINKIKAYNQQDLGFDTAEANKNLGFDYDERKYQEAISILEHYHLNEINLLTNNPLKLDAFKKSSILVKNRIALEIDPQEDNHHYLKTKKEFFGHLLDLV